MRKGLSFSEAGKLGAIKSSIIQKNRKEARIRLYNKDPILCKNCKKSLLYEKKRNIFCSQSCSASYNNQGIKRHFSTGNRASKPCLFCQKIMRNPKYCNHRCQKDHQWQL
ncbi:hypothetical protein LCGC14_0934920 [marine sediment metagenome]|uniref:Uncharacterized protein n=1 Tax=marine sediment metagenome TaxID=412755 RepID=A0A0F9NLW3_9ZZZZ